MCHGSVCFHTFNDNWMENSWKIHQQLTHLHHNSFLINTAVGIYWHLVCCTIFYTIHKHLLITEHCEDKVIFNKSHRFLAYYAVILSQWMYNKCQLDCFYNNKWTIIYAPRMITTRTLLVYWSSWLKEQSVELRRLSDQSGSHTSLIGFNPTDSKHQMDDWGSVQWTKAVYRQLPVGKKWL